MNDVISLIKKIGERRLYYFNEDFNKAYREGISLGCIPIDSKQLSKIFDKSTVFIDFTKSGSSILDPYMDIIREQRNCLYIYFNFASKNFDDSLLRLPNLFVQKKSQLNSLIELHTRNRIEYLNSFDHVIDESINNFYDWLYSADRYVFENMVSADKRMQKVFELMRRIAPSDVSVLINGETGTGKELIARALHNRSSRTHNPFVAVNCSAIPDTLLESELFGYEKGAFTGAYTSKKGLIELASGGTLFLDEIGDLPPIIQVKLLRVLQEREILRLGDTKPIKVDIRLVTATNQDLEGMVIEGRFRSDLYYRVNTVQINLPALRDRKEDIPLLTMYFINRLNQQSKKHIRRISNTVHEKFANYDWPGNIRELENIIERAFAVSIGEEITESDLPKRLQEFTGSHFVLLGKNEVPVETLKELEAARIKDLLINKNITLSESARILGIGRTTLWRKMREYGINKIESGGKFGIE
jgi:transcriptional regulator with PAS, ATPase and Fis domain